MAANPTVFLMYHEVEQPGVAPTSLDPGSLLYVVPRERFAAQVDWLRGAGFDGCGVSAWLDGREHEQRRRIVFTFDDGCHSDLAVAAPILAAAGFGATFYVTVDFVGRPGYLTRAGLRELHGAGFEIGSHSMTHAFLTDLDAAALRREMVDSKRWLEDAIGAPVTSFSCPGGRSDRRATAQAVLAGYRSLATSRVGANSATSSALALSRVPVTRTTDAAAFQRIAFARGLAGSRLRDAMLRLAKSVLGNQRYERVRARVLGGER